MSGGRGGEGNEILRERTGMMKKINPNFQILNASESN